MRETGMSEAEILNLPRRRLDSYLKLMNELYKKE